jgi:hypothetical protein
MFKFGLEDPARIGNFIKLIQKKFPKNWGF